ncbi:MAG: ribosome maturation factor RimP [Gammaproteobacteria bacterium]
MKLDSDGLEELFEPVVQGLGFDLWGVQLRSSENHAHVRIYIDHDDGITVDNCSEVSHQLSGVLDVEDPISVAYTLEVSSPGLDRPLMKQEHFKKYVGKEIKVRLGWAVQERRNFLGLLTKLDEENITMTVDGEQVEFPFNAVKRANLIYSDLK